MGVNTFEAGINDVSRHLISIIMPFFYALLNLIPVYPLDGGQALFIAYEMVTGRAPSDEFRRIAGIVGSIFIIIFFWILPLF